MTRTTRAANHKRAHGQFFTQTDPFGHPAFARWAEGFSPTETILEPFAGANHLIDMLRSRGFAHHYRSYDIDPQRSDVERRDTLRDFPTGFRVCVTNPPYLAKNVATRRRLPIPDLGPFDNLWKLAVQRCLDRCAYVAAIVPESLLTCGAFTDRLTAVVSLPVPMFADTDQPVCLALWVPEPTRTFALYSGEHLIGDARTLRRQVDALLPPTRVPDTAIVFNRPQGTVGLRAVDDTRTASIRFVPGGDIPPAAVTGAARHLTRIDVRSPMPVAQIVDRANSLLDRYRSLTGDLFLTAFKGVREDGAFRRRLDYATARRILTQVAFPAALA